ncbi:MAG: hypothetical protein H0W75_03540 [Chitinophagaceae bacterium]|nr:hypothetical protein [Chitinophagaceae bacterium]
MYTFQYFHQVYTAIQLLVCPNKVPPHSHNYGWMRFANNSQAKTFRLLHGKDYAIIWSRRTNSWTVIEVN